MVEAEVPKVLVVGSIQGRFRSALAKLTKLHQKQNFSFCIVVGDAFGHGSLEAHADELEELLDGSLKVPLQTYFTVGDSPLPQKVIEKLEVNDEVCTNLSYLGRKGTYKTSDGIKIVFVGGKLESLVVGTSSKYDPTCSRTDVSSLFGAHSTDILISNQWPANITSGSSKPVPEYLRTDHGAQSLAELCSKLKPRYHFSSSPGAFWEREPFQHSTEYGSFDTSGPCTRFASLGSIAGPTKEWLSAFKLDPNTEAPLPPTFTATPFAPSRKRAAETDHNSGYSRHGNGDHRGRRPQKRPRNNADEVCFMCTKYMDSNNSTHLVASVGEECIITIPRGPLPLPNTFPQLAWSGHLLIVPHYHAMEEVSEGARNQQDIEKEFVEMSKFRKALCMMANTISGGHLGAVCWDTNRTGIRHMHWQWMAVPATLLKQGLVEGAFKVLGEQRQCLPFEVVDADRLLPVKSDYFRLWIYMPPEQGLNPLTAADRLSGNGDADEGSERCIYLPVSSEQPFPIWFGREAMAKLLNLGSRMVWRDVQQRFEDEEADKRAFREQFAPWDFTLTEEEVDGEIE